MKILKYDLTKNVNSPRVVSSRIEDLMLNLSQLNHSTEKDQKWIFRGQPDSNFKLTPSAFRDDKIAEVKSYFPILSYDIFCQAEEFRTNIEGLAYAPFAQLIMLEQFRHLLEITFYIIQYNYYFKEFFSTHPEKFDSNSHHLNKLRPSQSWLEEKTFHDFFYRNLQNALTRIGRLDGKRLQNATFEEIFTGRDESFPQHYGFPTTGLDWSYNPYISLHFATDGALKNTTHFSLFACKLLHLTDKNPLILKHGHPEIENARIRNQEGIFICIRSACEFYYNYGIWPSIENYSLSSQGNFEIIKYEIPISYKDECRKLLESKGITHEFLFPDKIAETNSV